MSAVRPDPDALLARVQREEAKAKRGKLTIFFGATAGVGKTYTMLEAAQERKRKGADVVVGYVEPHGRADGVSDERRFARVDQELERRHRVAMLIGSPHRATD